MNHFIEIGINTDGYLSIVIHSGSRGVGHKIATYHMKQAAIMNTDKDRYALDFIEKNKDWHNKIMTTKPSKELDRLQEAFNKAKEEFIYRRVRARVDNIENAYPLNVTTEEGRNYINDMNMALQFALDNREFMIEQIRRSITTVTGEAPDVLRFINRNHNHAELVINNEQNFWIHRKGATHAEKGMLGVIPGNMKDGSFIVIGKGNPESMSSSSHGAGRVLSRSKAKETLSLEDFHSSMVNIITNHNDNTIDEAPLAYKNIFEVMDLQKDLVEIIDHIKPILNIKG